MAFDLSHMISLAIMTKIQYINIFEHYLDLQRGNNFSIDIHIYEHYLDLQRGNNFSIDIHRDFVSHVVSLSL